MDTIWRELKAQFIAGEGSLKELAARFGVSASAAEKRCSREKWVQEREKEKQRTVETITASARGKKLTAFERLIAEEEEMEDLIVVAQAYMLRAIKAPAQKGRIEIGREMAYLAQAIETCARVRRDLLEKPDQPERARQSVARAKVRLERERNRMAERAENAATGTIMVNVVGVDDAEEYGG